MEEEGIGRVFPKDKSLELNINKKFYMLLLNICMKISNNYTLYSKILKKMSFDYEDWINVCRNRFSLI